LVTGASRGIGRAIALELARAGFEIAVNYRTDTASAEETGRLIAATAGSARLVPFDVARREDAEQAILADIGRYGAYYGVVCNAGAHEDAAFPALSPGAWDTVIRTNLDGFYNVLRPAVMPMIRDRRGGRIVTMSSIAGLAGNRGQVNYSAAKAGLIGATRALARELAKRRITVNSVAPGLIQTEMTAGLALDEIVKLIPMRRLGTPSEVAATVAFLFSDSAAYITGQVISVNGGLR
jgi:3-oxoacyl-[acyl-carrier protein] reductase